ncbi:arginyl-tRNA--protein transferase 1 isoform X2 [Eupeodes corollae]|uniref:arginyl-tRNA--protein transferase 1 isoform X2 n=1 Tax=Eupeodes corollae TaxID=290404 RepID=UPI002490B3F7|nr:arginyl-tRNA--protein transferase 1 isoform X2 [Eupeodes corollae]
MEPTIINYYGKQTSRCGYCKNVECSNSHGMHAYNLAPQDYQDLIDRGWRRSGHYCYKPNNKNTCCPCYAIRCDTNEFKLSKSHKKILKRMTNFLRDGKKNKTEESTNTSSSATTSQTSSEQVQNNDPDDIGRGSIREEPQAPNVAIREVNMEAVVKANPQQTFSIPEQKKSSEVLIVGASANSSSLDGSKKSFDESKPPCKKAKQMRKERKEAKMKAKAAETAEAVVDPITEQQQLKSNKNQNQNREKTLKDFVNSASPNDCHKLKVILVTSNKGVTNEAFNIYRKYQLIIHKDDPARLKKTNLQRFCYKSPIKHTKSPGGPSCGYGSFHQQYWLDDKLIAVGVIDILPLCVSSVYFFYDPDYSFLSLGTYGSLREIEFVQQLVETVPTLKYYYMGYYIHSCPKMRYKGKLVPSYLLCPETYTWNLLTNEMRQQLDLQKYLRLNNDPEANDVDDFLETHLDLVMLLIENNTCVTYREYIQSFNIETIDTMLDMIRSRLYKEITGEVDDRESILEYGKLVGKTCAHRMLYVKV